jgi:hypothetical protein
VYRAHTSNGLITNNVLVTHKTKVITRSHPDLAAGTRPTANAHPSTIGLAPHTGLGCGSGRRRAGTFACARPLRRFRDCSPSAVSSAGLDQLS